MNILNILVPIIVLSIIIIPLTLLLVYAKQKLTPNIKLKININNTKEIEAEYGNTLINALYENKIYLPSGCGGKGSCGTCKCQVLEGGGEILQTEIPFFTYSQIQNKWRLACQVKVKDNLKISIPSELLEVKKFVCEVVSNKNVSTYIKELVLKVPDNQKFEFKSGGFIQVTIPPCTVDFSKDIIVEDEYKDEWTKYDLWSLKMINKEYTTRAYSLANYPSEGNIIMLNVRIATPPWDKKKNRFLKVNPGIGSSYLFSLKPKDMVEVSGPYGEFFLKDTNREMMFIGGGAGMAPMRSHIFHLFYTLNTKRMVTFWYGARSKREIFYEQEFREIERKFENFKFFIALSEPKKEDNWTGFVGFIHQVVYDNYLKNHPEPENIEYYICGPPLMLKAVLNMLDNLGVPKELIAYDDFGS